MTVGLLGTLIPIVPGLMLIWVVALLYGFLVDGFNAVGIGVMLVLTGIVAISVIKGFVVPKKAADAYGASGAAQIGALIGAIIGFFVIPVVGVIIGALVGVMVVEYLNHRAWDAAWKATKGVAVGFGASALIDFALGVVMLAAWAIWAATIIA